MRHTRAAAAIVTGLALATGVHAPPATAATESALAANTWTVSGLSSTTPSRDFVLRPGVTGYYLLDLGDLTEDYALSLHASSGQRLALSDRPGKAFEQVLTKLTGGSTYRLRVSAKRPSPTGRFVVRALALRAGVYVLDHNRITAYDPTGETCVCRNDTDLVGRIVNNTDGHVAISAGPRFQIFDRYGQRLPDAHYTRVAQRVISPHTISPFILGAMPSEWYRAQHVGLSYTSTTLRPVTSGVVAQYIRDAYGEDKVLVRNGTGARLRGTATIIQWGRRGGITNMSPIYYGGGNIDLAVGVSQTYRVSSSQIYNPATVSLTNGYAYGYR